MMVSCYTHRDKAIKYFDVVAVNQYPGWYFMPGKIKKARENLREALTALHDEHKKPVLVTEFGADTIAGLHALPGVLYSEEYQSELICALIEEMQSLDFVVAQHIWNFADFNTAQHHKRVGGNKKGIFTRDRQPKLAAHTVRALWKSLQKP
jgi:beta-glucuronidase